MQSTTVSTRSSPIPRNFASTDLHASYPGSCFDFSDLLSFAALHPVETLDLDGDADGDINTCTSSTPCSETLEHYSRHNTHGEVEADHDTPLELTYSASTAASSSSSMPSTSRSSSTSAQSLPSPALSSMVPTPGATREEEDIIDRVIKKLQGYNLGQEGELMKMEEAVDRRLDIAVVGSRRGSAMSMNMSIGTGTGLGMKPVVVSEEDSALWTKVWGSATAVRGAKERRMRRVGRKALAKIGMID